MGQAGGAGETQEWPKDKTNAKSIEISEETEDLVSDESESTAISSDDHHSDSYSPELSDSKAQEEYEAWRPWQPADTVDRFLAEDAMARPIKRRAALKVAMKAQTISRVRRGEWLIDWDILWALEMLRRRFPIIGGLEDTGVLAHGSSRCMATEPMNVYAIHTGGNHWAAVAVHGREGQVIVYDSLNHGRLAVDVQEQMDRVLLGSATYSLATMQQQTNVSDCGLYAIAAAFDLCEGMDPAGAQYDEGQLREHFAKCLETDDLVCLSTPTNQAEKCCSVHRLMGQ